MVYFLIFLFVLFYVFACIGISELLKGLANNKVFQIIISSSEVVTTNPITSKIWGDRNIDSHAIPTQIYHRIEWVEFIENFSPHIKDLFEKGYLTCGIHNYAEQQENKTLINIGTVPKSFKDFETEQIRRILSFINTSRFGISPQDYFANHGELIKQTYKKTEKL